MELFKVDTIQEAVKKLQEAVKSFNEGFFKTEKIKCTESLGRTLAEDVVSPIDVPGFTRSTVDGYALKSADTYGASENVPVFLKIIGEVEMGKSADFVLDSAQAAYVPTGGMLPEGADSVMMIEFCEKFGEDSIAVNNTLSFGRNTVLKGEDLKTGEIILKAGSVIRPQDIGAFSSVGISEATVYTPLNIGIISTGDELVSPGEALTNGKIYDINTYSLANTALKRGFNVVYNAVVPDRRETIVEKLKQAMNVSDIVLLSGGSSQGEKDMTADIINSISSPGVFTHGLAVKPGKPTILGADKNRNTILAGLPGHPVAAMMVFEMVIARAFDELMEKNEPIGVFAVMEDNYGADQGKANCIPVKLIKENGGYKARVIFGKSSLMSTLTQAFGYIVTERNKEGLSRGETVFVHLF